MPEESSKFNLNLKKGGAPGPEFKTCVQQAITNTKLMAEEFSKLGYKVIPGSINNCIVIVDMTDKELTGKETEIILERRGLLVSRSTIPNDPNPPMNPSGVRFGTAAITTRGMKQAEIKKIVEWVNAAIEQKDNMEMLDSIKDEVKKMCLEFPIPSI
jgi:glycine hydroxymethyltransferase